MVACAGCRRWDDRDVGLPFPPDGLQERLPGVGCCQELLVEKVRLRRTEDCGVGVETGHRVPQDGLSIDLQNDRKLRTGPGKKTELLELRGPQRESGCAAGSRDRDPASQTGQLGRRKWARLPRVGRLPQKRGSRTLRGPTGGRGGRGGRGDSRLGAAPAPACGRPRTESDRVFCFR